jgi:RNA polymerase sigma-70 factor (ECF subfamily)
MNEDTKRIAASAAMDRYASGEDAAFAELYDALAPRLYAFALRMARQPARADDLVQQTFLQMHCARRHFVRGADVLPWAFAIARRLFIDITRRGRREVLGAEGPEPQARGDAPDQIAEAHELAQRMERALETMPALQREAYELVRRDGLSTAQAAEVLGTTPNAVKLRAHRAYEVLRAIA